MTRRPGWIAPLKLNVWALAFAIWAIVWVCVEATSGIVAQTLPMLLTSDIADEVRTAALHLLGTVAGMQFASLAIAGMVSWGIKLLDDRAEEPTVPASTHERVVAGLAASASADGDVLNAIDQEASQ